MEHSNRKVVEFDNAVSRIIKVTLENIRKSYSERNIKQINIFEIFSGLRKCDLSNRNICDDIVLAFSKLSLPCLKWLLEQTVLGNENFDELFSAMQTIILQSIIFNRNDLLDKLNDEEDKLIKNETDDQKNNVELIKARLLIYSCYKIIEIAESHIGYLIAYDGERLCPVDAEIFELEKGFHLRNMKRTTIIYDYIIDCLRHDYFGEEKSSEYVEEVAEKIKLLNEEIIDHYLLYREEKIELGLMEEEDGAELDEVTGLDERFYGVLSCHRGLVPIWLRYSAYK